MARIRQIQTFKCTVSTIVPDPDRIDGSAECKWTAEYRVLGKDAEREISKERSRLTRKLRRAMQDATQGKGDDDEIDKIQEEVNKLNSALINRILVSVPTDDSVKHRLEVEACNEDGEPIFENGEPRLLRGEELREFVINTPMFAATAVDRYNESTKGLPEKN